MKVEKKRQLVNNILLLLNENQYISVNKISMVLGISESTIRRNIYILENMLAETDTGRIEKIPGKGLHLVINGDNQAFNNSLLLTFDSSEIRNIVTEEQQIYKYLFELFLTEEKCTIEQLSEKMYDSVSTVKKKLNICADWLSLFGLKLVVKKNYGVYIDGNEENHRVAIKHILLNNDLYNPEEGLLQFADQYTAGVVAKCISTIEDEWNFKFTEESFNSMKIYGVLSVVRNKKHAISTLDYERETVYKYNEYNWAKSLFEMLQKELNIDFDDNEIVFFAIQLLCSGLMHDSRYEENNAYKYDEKMKEFIRVVISSISDVLNVELDKDEEFYRGLLNHIRPAIFRMKFEKHNTKSLTNFVKEEYKETYRVSWILSMLFEEYYGINISSTELSYITLYIQSALERSYKPVKIVFVTELGMGLNQMFCNKIRMAIPKVEKITIVSLHDFNISMLKEYDLVITTSAINISDDRIIQISSLLNEDGLALINQSIKNLNNKKISKKPHFDVSCHSFFDPGLIFTQVKLRDKTEILEMLTNKMVEKGYVKDKFLNSVLKREKAVSTCIGNGVAIPHGNTNYVNDSKVAIALLEEPISWDSDDEQISAIFLLGFKIDSPESSKQVQLFYKVFLDLIQTDENVEYLKSFTSEELYKELVQ